MLGSTLYYYYSRFLFFEEQEIVEFCPMEKPWLIYCYDAYCGWCYAFTPVMKGVAAKYRDAFQLEVLSGGMIIHPKARHISVMAPYIQQAYTVVEEHAGIKFGPDYLWHINNPDLSDWYPSSEKPAIALCIFKEFYPERQLEFAGDMQHALHGEGRDLCDDEAYRHLLEKYSIQPELFFSRLASEEYKQLAYDEFALCKQLQVSGFPAVLLQENESKFHLVARGYTSSGELEERIEGLITAL